MPDAIPIIGGTGALGYGLALRWGRAGQPVVIGSREAGRAREAGERLKSDAPDAEATRTIGVWQGSAAQQAQEMVPDGVTVVSAVHTVGAPSLADGTPLDEDVLVCGDKKAPKAKVARLIEQIEGLRPVNAGPLEMARIVETLTPMLISVNVRYKTHAGIKLTGLPEGDHWA